jgi:hypothetical protein
LKRSGQRKKKRKETEDKLLQAANLSPVNTDTLEKLVNMHPMKQVAWASVIQFTMFGLMMLAFYLIGLFV